MPRMRSNRWTTDYLMWTECQFKIWLFQSHRLIFTMLSKTLQKLHAGRGGGAEHTALNQQNMLLPKYISWTELTAWKQLGGQSVNSTFLANKQQHTTKSKNKSNRMRQTRTTNNDHDNDGDDNDDNNDDNNNHNIKQHHHQQLTENKQEHQQSEQQSAANLRVVLTHLACQMLRAILVNCSRNVPPFSWTF